MAAFSHSKIILHFYPTSDMESYKFFSKLQEPLTYENISTYEFFEIDVERYATDRVYELQTQQEYKDLDSEWRRLHHDDVIFMYWDFIIQKSLQNEGYLPIQTNIYFSTEPATLEFLSQRYFGKSVVTVEEFVNEYKKKYYSKDCLGHHDLEECFMKALKFKDTTFIINHIHEMKPKYYDLGDIEIDRDIVAYFYNAGQLTPEEIISYFINACQYNNLDTVIFLSKGKFYHKTKSDTDSTPQRTNLISIL